MKRFFLLFLLVGLCAAEEYTISVQPIPLPFGHLSFLSAADAEPGFYVMALNRSQQQAKFRGEFRVSLRYSFAGETFRVTRTFVPQSEERPPIILVRFFAPGGARAVSVEIEDVPYEPVKEITAP